MNTPHTHTHLPTNAHDKASEMHTKFKSNNKCLMVSSLIYAWLRWQWSWKCTYFAITADVDQNAIIQACPQSLLT